MPDLGQLSQWVLATTSILTLVFSAVALSRSNRLDDFKETVKFLQERNDVLRNDVRRSDSRCDLLESNLQKMRTAHNQLLSCFNQVVSENKITILPCNPEPLDMRMDLPTAPEMVEFIQKHFIRSELDQLIWFKFNWKKGDFKDSSFNELAQSVVNRAEREGKFYDLLRAVREERPLIRF